MTTATRDYYTTAEIARITGVSQRQLQWWDEQGVLTVMQRHHARQYRAPELFAVAVMRNLRERRVSLQDIRRIWKHIEHNGIALPDESRRYLVTDGGRLKFFARESDVVAFLSQCHPLPYVVLSLAGIQARLAVDTPRALATMPRKAMGRAEVLSVAREAKQA